MATQIEPIRGKVAKILSSREVALNIGREEGVEVGMIFDILSPKGSDIVDPDTGEALGSVDLPKTRVKITRVYDKLSMASTYRTKRVNVGGALTAATLFNPPMWETQYETLKIDGGFERSTEELDEADSYIATGDQVVQLIDSGK